MRPSSTMLLKSTGYTYVHHHKFGSGKPMRSFSAHLPDHPTNACHGTWAANACKQDLYEQKGRVIPNTLFFMPSSNQ